jgi:pheromone shutdown protein TraB
LERNRASQRLVIIGTTHVDKSSIEGVHRTIADTRPSVVAVELCEERLWALRDKERNRVGSPISSGLLPWLLALLERAVGSMTDVFPGSEMLEAVEEAQRVGSQIVMIDKPIGQILENLKTIPVAEKVKIGIDSLVALFTIRSGRKAIFSASQDLDKVMIEFNVKYPTLSRILVQERDQYMADRLREILRLTSGRVVAVVGLGHVRGIMENLAQFEQALSDEHLRIRYEWTVGGFP